MTVQDEPTEEAPVAPDYNTIVYEKSPQRFATITLNRPDRMNSITPEMQAEFSDVWDRIRVDDDVHCVVLRAVGDESFCTGIDFSVTSTRHRLKNPFAQYGPGTDLGPKQNNVWKPVIAAVNGMCSGSAFYWLNEADIIICSDNATFFDQHVSYGLVASTIPSGLLYRIPLGEVLRLVLRGMDERMSATRAHQIGLVSEVVPRAELWDRANHLAEQLADKPPAAVQGSIKGIWQALDMGRTAGQAAGLAYSQVGSPISRLPFDPSMYEKNEVPPFEVR